MAIYSRGFKALAFAAALSAAGAAQAVTNVTVNLGPPIINGNTASMDVTLDFFDDGNPSAGLTFIQIGVGGSDGSLSAGGTNYSRFSFTPGSAFNDNGWVLFGDFADPFLDAGSVSYTAPSLPPAALEALYALDNTHTLGTLNVDLTGLGAGTVHLIDIGIVGPGPSDSFALFFPFDNPQGFEDFVGELNDASITTQVITVPRSTAPAVPEPASIMLGLFGLAGLALRRRKA